MRDAGRLELKIRGGEDDGAEEQNLHVRRAIAIAWAAVTVALLWPGWSVAAHSTLVRSSVAVAIVLVALGLIRTLRGPRPAQSPDRIS